MENIITMCAAGYPTSGVIAAPSAVAVHQVKTAAFQRDRFGATGVTVTQNADLPPDPSATTSERRT